MGGSWTPASSLGNVLPSHLWVPPRVDPVSVLDHPHVMILKKPFPHGLTSSMDGGPSGFVIPTGIAFSCLSDLGAAPLGGLEGPAVTCEDAHSLPADG